MFEMLRNMKVSAFYLTGILFFWASVAPGDGLMEFHNYKGLPRSERRKVAHQSTPELQKRYKRWDRIIMAGWQCADNRQIEALMDAKDLPELGGPIGMQITIHGWYLAQEFDRKKKLGMTDDQAMKSVTDAGDIKAMEKERYKDFWWYQVKVAPTAEALALSQKSASLAADWYGRFSGTQEITPKDLREVDAAVNELRAKMRALPQLTSDEIEAALAALPEPEAHR
jgi:hypothetical protein